MSGITPTAVLLAAALLTAPNAARRTKPRRRTLAAPRHTGAMLGGLAVAFAALATGPAVAAAVGTLAITIAAHLNRRLRRRNSCREGRALAAALETLVGELRVGSHPVRGFAVAAAESSGAVAAALAAVAARARMGADVGAGLRSVARGSAASHYWVRVAVCWQLAAEHGLPMATLMHAAHQDISDRQRFTDRVEASLSGARATAAVLSGLPLLGILFGQLIGAASLAFLLGDGAGVLAVGVALLCAGAAWSDRIIDGVVR